MKHLPVFSVSCDDHQVMSVSMISERRHEPLAIDRQLTFVDIFTAIRTHLPLRWSYLGGIFRQSERLLSDK